MAWAREGTMLMKPARIVAIAVSVAMLIAVSVFATGLDSASADRPSSPRGAPMVRIPGHVLGALARATRIKSAPNAGDSPITLTLTLNRHDQAGFDRYLHQVYDPHSKNFHHFLTQREIADRFGPSQTSYDAVL
ncbi:MAG TPA: protease pro-enzyme activation domain-containing protein, partial [Candidatus Binataceae bacterium]|nr:protease pro-enzyme activation domain-containing protein [Candidatus Binataceae bacterium]